MDSLIGYFKQSTFSYTEYYCLFNFIMSVHGLKIPIQIFMCVTQFIQHLFEQSLNQQKKLFSCFWQFILVPEFKLKPLSTLMETLLLWEKISTIGLFSNSSLKHSMNLQHLVNKPQIVKILQMKIEIINLHIENH